MDPEEIQAQFDEIIARMDENDQALSDFSDNLDSNLSDIQDTNTDFEERLSQVEENSGQLLFPLSQESIDLIKEQFPSGFVTLVAGTAILIDPRISPTSNILLTVATPGGTQGFLYYTAAVGNVTITSTSNTETSVVSYLILN